MPSMTDGNERIERAALRLTATTWTVPRPGRHADVARYVKKVQPWKTDADLAQGEEGFWTSHGRFVDRFEGKAIARAAGQLHPIMFERALAALLENPKLYSEDVW